MDKNTIIGFLLMGLILFGFTWLSRPTPEQLEAQQHYLDSLARVENARLEQVAMVAEQERKAEEARKTGVNVD